MTVGGPEDYWVIPPEIYEPLNREFHFDFDPCPYPRPEGFDGLTCEWGKSNWVNPLFGRGITAFVRKGIEEWKKGKTVVLILPLDNWVKLLVEAIGVKEGSMGEIRVVGKHRWLKASDPTKNRPASRPSFLFILKSCYSLSEKSRTQK